MFDAMAVHETGRDLGERVALHNAEVACREILADREYADLQRWGFDGHSRESLLRAEAARAAHVGTTCAGSWSAARGPLSVWLSLD